jgi:CRP/FNR family cyclic AMP-dependent transcriptional regulator
MRKVLYIFGLLTDADITWIASTGVCRAVQSGEILIREGVQTPSMIFLLQGEFKVDVQGFGEVARLGPGEIVGEMSFVDSAPPSATVTATNSGVALFLDKAAVAAKLDADAPFGCRFYHALAVFLADRLRGTRGRRGYDNAAPLESEEVVKDELDLGVLDNLSMAGDRFDRLLKLVSAENRLAN